MKDYKTDISAFIDENGRIKQLPSKQIKRADVLCYLADKFEQDRIYTEKEVNNICDEWHTFKDYFVLRRGLVDEAFLIREADGSRYWRSGGKK